MPGSHLRSIQRLAWPMLVGQLAVVATGFADTVMAGHYRSEHLAAVGLGASIYITIYVTFMGVLQGLSPLLARSFGAGEFIAIGATARQGVLLALVLMLPGVALLRFPDFLFTLFDLPMDMRPLVRAYLAGASWGLPAAMLVRVFYNLAPAVGHPRMVMVINLLALGIKIPLSYALLYGYWGLPELGAPGCAYATAAMLWTMCLLAGFASRRSDYHRFELWSHPLRFERQRFLSILRIGLPISLAQLIEVTSFTFMALLLARLGPTVSATHQIASNMVVMAFMLPLNFGLATQILLSQALGRGEPETAAAVARTGLKFSLAVSLGLISLLLLGQDTIVGWYTSDPAVRQLALTFIPVLAALHFFDALQGVSINILRGYHQTTLPTAIYAVSLWGIGLGGGWWLTFGNIDLPALGIALPSLGAVGMWVGCTVSLAAAGLGLLALLQVVIRNSLSDVAAPAH